MSRGIGRVQAAILDQLAEPGRGRTATDPNVWHLVSDLALAIHGTDDEASVERIRRALRSLARRELVELGRVNVDTWRRRWSEPQQRTVSEGVYRPMLAACLPRPAEVVAAERADIKRRAQEAAAVLGIRWPIGDLPLSDDPTVASGDGPRPALTEPVQVCLHPALITREDHR